MSETDFYIRILELEIAALRSVLSEFDEDKIRESCTQWQKAESLAELKNYIVRPS